MRPAKPQGCCPVYVDIYARAADLPSRGRIEAIATPCTTTGQDITSDWTLPSTQLQTGFSCTDRAKYQATATAGKKHASVTAPETTIGLYL